MATDSLRERDVPLNTLMPLIREELSAGKSVRFSPRGVSMLPMLRPGMDTVTISPPPEKLKKYDLPLYRRDNGKYIIGSSGWGRPIYAWVITSLARNMVCVMTKSSDW